jgi:hypothetical protein
MATKFKLSQPGMRHRVKSRSKPNFRSRVPAFLTPSLAYGLARARCTANSVVNSSSAGGLSRRARDGWRPRRAQFADVERNSRSAMPRVPGAEPVGSCRAQRSPAHASARLKQTWIPAVGLRRWLSPTYRASVRWIRCFEILKEQRPSIDRARRNASTECCHPSPPPQPHRRPRLSQC